MYPSSQKRTSSVLTCQAISNEQAEVKVLGFKATWCQWCGFSWTRCLPCKVRKCRAPFSCLSDGNAFRWCRRMVAGVQGLHTVSFRITQGFYFYTVRDISLLKHNLKIMKTALCLLTGSVNQETLDRGIISKVTSSFIFTFQNGLRQDFETQIQERVIQTISK